MNEWWNVQLYVFDSWIDYGPYDYDEVTAVTRFCKLEAANTGDKFRVTHTRIVRPVFDQ